MCDGIRMAGAGSSKSCLSLALDCGGPKLPYCRALPGDLASPDRSLSSCVSAADLERVNDAPLPLVLREGVKPSRLVMPKIEAGVVARGASAPFFVNVGVALVRWMARATALMCFLPAL